MGNYEQLKQAVSNVIKVNGNQEITGTILQDTLLSIISSIGSNSTFKGVANPSTDPGTPDQNVFYITDRSGIYVNFNGIEVNECVSVLINDANNQWKKINTNIGFELNNILSSNSMPLYKGSVFLKNNILDNEINSAVNNRCCSKVFKTQNVKLSITDGFVIKLIYADDQFNSVGNILSGVTSITTQYPYGRLVVAKNNDSDFSLDDVKLNIIGEAQSEEIQKQNEEIQILNANIEEISWNEEGITVNTADGSFLKEENRRTTHLKATRNIIKIVFPDKTVIKYYIFYYDKEKKFIRSYGWLSNKEYYIQHQPDFAYFVLLIDTTTIDYKSVSFFSNIDNAIQDLEIVESKIGYYSQISPKWEKGGINSLSGYNNNDTAYFEIRRRTKAFLHISADTKILSNVTATNAMQIYFYDANNAFISTYPSSSTFSNLDKGGYIAINDLKPENAITFRISLKYPEVTEPENNLKFSRQGTGLCKDIEDIKNNYRNSKNLLIVDKEGYGDYVTIEDALNNANDTDENHVVIIVMPGIYYPAPKKSSSEVPYVEINRNISIIGIDKNSCVLKGNVGYYYYQHNIDYSLLRLNGNVTIKNLTLDNRSELYEQTAKENNWDLSLPHCRAYCIHTDGSRQKNSIIEVENCLMYNDHFTCLGFGTRPDSTLKILNCDITSDVSTEKNKLSGFENYGTLYGHLHSGSTEKNQNLEITRCKIVNSNYETAINLLDAAGEGAEGNVILIQNACATSANVKAFKKVEKFVISKSSSGNNISNMNF
jgi:hypothetical protein